MWEIITERPDRNLSVRNVHIDYYVKFPLSAVLALVISIPWLVVATGDIPVIAAIILVLVNLFANLVISIIVVFQWFGSLIDDICKKNLSRI